MTRNTLLACLLISFLSSSLVFGKPVRRTPASLTVHTYTFTSAVFPSALLPLKEEYEKQKPMTSYQGWQGVGKKAEMINLLRQLSVLNGPQMAQQTSIYPVEGAAEAAAHWQKIQAELAALVSHPEIGRPYFGLVLSPGELPGTILHQLASGYPIWVASQQSYLSLVYSATLRPGGFVCHIFQNNDDRRSPYRYYGVIVSCDLPSR